MLCGLHDGQVGVGYGKVAEDVHGSELDVGQVEANRVRRTVVGGEVADNAVAHGNHGDLVKVPRAKHVARVEVQLPAEGDQERGHGRKELGLHADPRLHDRVPGLGSDPVARQRHGHALRERGRCGRLARPPRTAHGRLREAACLGPRRA